MNCYRFQVLLFISAFLIHASVVAQNISAGQLHNLLLCQDGTVWSNGFNAVGNLGLGTNNTREPIPKQIPSLDNIVAIQSSILVDYTLFLKKDGTVWGTGDNGPFTLGLGDNINRNVPTLLDSIRDVLAMSAGVNHSLFLLQDSTVRGCGLNLYGELGPDSLNRAIRWGKQIDGLTEIVQIAAGNSFSLFLKKDGTVYSCGNNANGELGLGHLDSIHSPRKIDALSDIIAISAGWDYSLFLKKDGSVWACGNNTYGQFGNGGSSIQNTIPFPSYFLSDVVSIDASSSYGELRQHSLFLKKDGTAWSAGCNYFGQLGVGDTINRLLPTQVDISGKVKSIATGGFHSLFLLENGSVWACGDASYGQLGNGDTTTKQLVPIPLSSNCGSVTKTEVYRNNKIQLYPNPNAGSFTISSTTDIDQIKIYDQTGRIVKTLKGINSNSVQIDLENVGVYFVEIAYGESTEVLRTIVVH